MKLLPLFALLFLILTAGTASGQFWWCAECAVTTPNTSAEELVLFVLPDGSGSPFTQAQVKGQGTEVDGSILLELLDDFRQPIVDFPAEDAWLEPDGGDLVLCVSGANADTNSDDAGYMWWTTPLHAGGFSEAPLQVMVNGLPVPVPPLDFTFNSADLNGDLQVNLSDIGVFTSDFFSGFNLRSDFFADGILNLSDVGRMAQGLGAVCP